MMRKLLILALLFCCSFARAESIVLVRGTASTPDAAERNYAQSLTRRLTRWLNDMNVSHRVIDDEEVTVEALKTARVVILGYNPYPTGKELAALKVFVGRGGKLIVFYSADPGLAKLLNMRLGRYMASDTPGRWSAIRFNKSAPAHLPKAIFQESHNIRPVFPAGDDSRIIAWWENGKDPAWVQSDRGLWMSHVLLDDGDTENKKQMLLGLIAVYEPSVWRTAAARYLEMSGRVGEFRNLEDAVQGIRRQSRGSSMESRIEAMLAQAGTLHRELTQLFGEQKYPDVVEKSRALTSLLIEAYGCVQQSRANEFRGVWDHSGTGLYPEDWNRTCEILAAHGFTDVMPNMLSPGLAHYDSRELLKSETFRRYGDQLAQCLAAARRHGIRVHVWKVCWKVDSAADGFVKQLKKQGRLQVSDTGQTINWLCPSHPDNLKLEKDALREVAQNYAVDGIHLDYIRYRDSHVCYCAGCRKRFEKELGRKLRNWPSAARSGATKKEYSRWRCAQITRLVRDVGAALRAVNPDVRLSAAVFGKYPACVDSVAQDWGMWLRNGYVDFVCPMNYTSDIGQFTALTRSQAALPLAGGRIFPGIGVTASESRLGPVQVVDQILALRQEGASGFVLFDLNRVLETEILPVLSLGIIAEPGEVSPELQDQK